MKERGFCDNDVRKLLGAYRRGELRPVKDQKKAKRTAVQAARRYRRKGLSLLGPPVQPLTTSGIERGPQAREESLAAEAARITPGWHFRPSVVKTSMFRPKMLDFDPCAQ